MPNLFRRLLVIKKFLTTAQRKLRFLSEFIKERYHRDDLAFRELSSDFIREFDFFIRMDKGCTHNTVWVYTMPLITGTYSSIFVAAPILIDFARNKPLGNAHEHDVLEKKHYDKPARQKA